METVCESMKFLINLILKSKTLMKKAKVIFGALLALAMTACEKDEGLKVQDNGFSITATREANEDNGADTRATISGGTLSWSAQESIAVYNGTSFTGFKTQDGGATATFTGEKIAPTNYAVYPYSLSPTLDGSTLKVTLPDTYEGITEAKEGYTSGEAYPPMVATIAAAGSTSLYFENLGGLVMFNVTGLPKKYTQLIFKTTNNMPITGEFSVTESGGKKVIESNTTAGTTANTVTFKFTNSNDTNDMVFYVPLPVLASGVERYEFSIDFADAEGNTLFTTPKKGWVKIERSKYFKFNLALGSTSGGAEEGTAEVIVPSSATDFALPSTTGTVNVKMMANDNASVTLKYSDDGTHPSKVNINCCGNITGTLIVDLADSHVEVNKATSITAENITINALTSTTSSSTLVLGETMKIGGTLTVAKGSAEIKGTVKNVTVSAKTETDSSTEEVTIKVASGATVEETLTVGQGNVEIAGTVKNVTVANTVAETATVKVASTATISDKLEVAKGSVEVAGSVKEVAVAASVSNVTIAAAVQTVTVAAATSGEDDSAAPVIWVEETGSVTSSLTNNNSNTTVVAKTSETGGANPIASVAGTASGSTTIKTPATYMAEKIGNGGTVTLENDIKANITIQSGNAVINLNGKKISNASEAPVITVNNGATLVINGTGEIENTSSDKDVIENKGTLTINGGTYTGDADLINNQGTLNINGGTYNAKESVPSVFAVNNTGSINVDTGVELRVNDKSSVTYYVASEKALNTAIAGTNTTAKNIIFTADITITSNDKLVIDSGNTFDVNLSGYILNGRTNLKHGKVTFRNGTIAGGKEQALNVYGSTEATATDYSVLVVEKDVKVTADVWAVCIFGSAYNKNGYGAVANIYGTLETTGDGTEGAVFVSGNLGQYVDADFAASSTNIVNIYGSVTSQKDAAIAINGAATVNVYDGATVTGNTAIAIKRGKLVVNGGTITGTGEAKSNPAVNGNGTEMTGSAVSATSTYSKHGPLSVEINGGTITSEAFTILNNSDYEFNISGGTFKSTLQTSAIVVWARLGSVNITGGSFENCSNEEATLYIGTKLDILNGKQPKLTVSGEKTVVKNTADGAYKWNNNLAPLTVNMFNEVNYKAVNISGGTFYGNNPSQDDNVKTEIGNFLADGYKATETSTNVWLVKKKE